MHISIISMFRIEGSRYVTWICFPGKFGLFFFHHRITKDNYIFLMSQSDIISRFFFILVLISLFFSLNNHFNQLSYAHDFFVNNDAALVCGVSILFYI